MWHLVKYDQKWTFFVKMDMGVIKWLILSIDIQIGQDVYTFSKKKKQRCSRMRHGAKWDMYTINFGKENITYKCLQVVGKSHIDR